MVAKYYINYRSRGMYLPCVCNMFRSAQNFNETSFPNYKHSLVFRTSTNTYFLLSNFDVVHNRWQLFPTFFLKFSEFCFIPRKIQKLQLSQSGAVISNSHIVPKDVTKQFIGCWWRGGKVAKTRHLADWQVKNKITPLSIWSLAH